MHGDCRAGSIIKGVMVRLGALSSLFLLRSSPSTRVGGGQVRTFIEGTLAPLHASQGGNRALSMCSESFRRSRFPRTKEQICCERNLLHRVWRGATMNLSTV